MSGEHVQTHAFIFRIELRIRMHDNAFVLFRIY